MQNDSQKDEVKANPPASFSSHFSLGENREITTMVNAPPPSWHEQQNVAYRKTDPMDITRSENVQGKVNVYSTSSSVEVEAATALMSLPTSTSLEQQQQYPTFSSLAASAQQEEQQRFSNATATDMMCETTSSAQPYDCESHPQDYASSYEHDYHQEHRYPSKYEYSAAATSFRPYHDEYAPAPLTEGPRFQFAESSSSTPRLSEQHLQPSHSFRRRSSFCSSTSDSSVGSSSFQPSIASFQPSVGSSSFQPSVGSSSLQPSVGSASFHQHSVGSSSFQQHSVGSSSFHQQGSLSFHQVHQHTQVSSTQAAAEVASSSNSNTPRFQFAEAAAPPHTFRRKQSYCSSSDSSVSSNDSSCLYENSTGPWVPGSISLALDEDEEVLSPLHCFMRKYCVEAFSATQEDVATPRYGKAHGGKIVAGQVGIRCLHCKQKPISQRPERAVCFPSSLKNIYHSIETWQRRHSVACTDLPDWIKRELTDLMQSSRSSAGGRRQYWQDAAKRLGMVDTPCGVRFSRTPGLLEPASSSVDVEVPNQEMDPAFVSQPLVGGQDKPLVTDYLFLLMSQMESCQFSEEDRTGGRSKVKLQEVGFPGMQCRHCRGKAGFGRYFPQSSQSLALANSDRNIFNHVMKCRKCPAEIKEQLLQLQQEQQSGPKNKRGSRKLFFTRIWERLHRGREGQGSAVAATADSIASAWFGTNI